MKKETAMIMQGRVLFALVMREMTTRFGRTAGGYVWAVLEPAATVAILTVIFSYISRHPPLGSNFGLFFATGYMPFHIYKDMSGAVSSAVSANKALLTYPRITMLDTIIARSFLHFMTSTFVAFLILTALYKFQSDQALLRFQPIFLSIFLAACLGASVGIFNCALFPYSPTWQQTFQLINRPLFLISGVFFLYEDLPRFAQDIIWWNPLLHVLALMRSGFYPNYEPIFVSLNYVISFAAIFFLLGIMLLRLLKGKILER